MSAGHLHRLPGSEIPAPSPVIEQHADQRVSSAGAADHGEGSGYIVPSPIGRGSG
jgi:hypothetical protein